jgi:hypothetical protein
MNEVTLVDSRVAGGQGPRELKSSTKMGAPSPWHSGTWESANLNSQRFYAS